MGIWKKWPWVEIPEKNKKKKGGVKNEGKREEKGVKMGKIYENVGTKLVFLILSESKVSAFFLTVIRMKIALTFDSLSISSPNTFKFPCFFPLVTIMGERYENLRCARENIYGEKNYL